MVVENGMFQNGLISLLHVIYIASPWLKKILKFDLMKCSRMAYSLVPNCRGGYIKEGVVNFFLKKRGES